VDASVSWFPAVSLKALKEEIRLLQETPWRSVKALVRHACLLSTFTSTNLLVFDSPLVFFMNMI